MRGFLILIFFVGTLWAIDAVAFGGHYSSAVWQEANHQGKKARSEIRDWLQGFGL